MMAVTIYANGFVHCSVCVPHNLPISKIEEEVNAVNPTGLDHGWTVDNAPAFADGSTNPHHCEQDATKLHYLMAC